MRVKHQEQQMTFRYNFTTLNLIFLCQSKFLKAFLSSTNVICSVELVGLNNSFGVFKEL